MKVIEYHIINAVNEPLLKFTNKDTAITTAKMLNNKAKKERCRVIEVITITKVKCVF